MRQWLYGGAQIPRLVAQGLGLGLLLLAGPATAEDATVRLRSFLHEVQSFDANFIQRRFDEGGREVETATGSFKLLRPGQFLWDYAEPFRQLIVSDGRQVWLYDVELEQVTVQTVDKALGSSPAALLGASVDLETAYDISELPASGGLSWAALASRDDDGDFAGVRLGFDANGLRVMELDDNFGQRTRIEFSDQHLNPVIARSVFEFKVPLGVDVVTAE